jgi:hypothetical protein
MLLKRISLEELMYLLGGPAVKGILPCYIRRFFTPKFPRAFMTAFSKLPVLYVLKPRLENKETERSGCWWYSDLQRL